MSTQHEAWQPGLIHIDENEVNPYNGATISTSKDWTPFNYKIEMDMACIEADFILDKLINPLDFKELDFKDEK